MGMEFKDKIVLECCRKGHCEYSPATGILCWVYDVLGELYLTRLSDLMGSKADSRRAICDRFTGGEPPNFDIVNPVSKSKGAETENLNLFFGWLGVFYLLAVGVDGMEQSLVEGQLKCYLVCSVKNMSENYWTNLCASLED